MFRWPPAIPTGPHFVLRRASVPKCLLDSAVGKSDAEDLVRVNITVAAGCIEAVSPAESTIGNDVVDLDLCQVWPCFVDMHTHLDKGHIWPRAQNPDGTFAGALTATAEDRGRRWTEDDVSARMAFGLRSAFAHGTAAIRTHLDSVAPHHAVAWPVFARMREEWRGRIALQAVTITLLENLMGPFGDDLADLVSEHKGVLGAVALPAPDLDLRLDRIFTLAANRGLDLDFHADESGDPQARALAAIGQARLRHRFQGNVVVGHCCSLAVQSDDEIDRTLDLVAEAALSIVSLPMCNLYLQDRRPGRTPRWRGVTLLHEMRARGIPVALASDNCRDPFHGYGDHDGFEVFRESVRIAHLDRPVGSWPAAVSRVPANVSGFAPLGRIKAGAAADLVLFNARGYSELLSRPQADRIVLRSGCAIDTAPPSYRELDRVLTGEGQR